MKSEKVEGIIGQLCRSGFSMTTHQFYETTILNILGKYGIKARLEIYEYIELMENIMDLCAENDLKNMGINYLNENDLQFK